MEKAKVLRNLEKLVNRDFGFINAGRIVIVADSRKVNVDMVNSICNKLKVETNHITKNELKKIIAELEIELDYLAPEVEKLKRD